MVINNLGLNPIAKKVIRAMYKENQKKVIDFKTWKIAKDYYNKLQQERENRDLSRLDPLHAIYTDTQHRISEFIEQFSILPESEVLNLRHLQAEDIYLPSGPPMSPLTPSYFFCWTACDMNVGIKRETYTTIMIEICKTIGADPSFIKLVSGMQGSRMGLYVHQKQDGKFVYLKELYTNQLIKARCTSQYYGTPGEIWLVRLLSDPFGYVDYSITFTTPYVIIKGSSEAKTFNLHSFYTEDLWLEFIERNLASIKVKDPRIAYDHFMKYGLSKHYWPEYIFQAYVNHQENVIWLTGFPDRSETLPHSS